MQNPTSTATVIGDAAVGAQVMGIDEQGMSTVLAILSNMYSDGSLAVVREYACNALDSHVEAGNPDPILVTAPSFFQPNLVVQDFGVGLSKDEVLNVYAKYGASTKRTSNDQIGAFGIGAKSAFTVGTQFIVTAVKDGMMTVALFALDESGAPTVNIVMHEETDEPNGVKVEIGVKDVKGVQAAIERLFATWKPGTVLVDGVEPASIWTEARELAPNVHLSQRADRFDDNDPAFLIVMGGVPYRMTTAAIDSLPHRQRTIVHGVQGTTAKAILTVGIGDVDITPSREDLRVTPKTTATLTQAVEDFHASIGPWIVEQIDAAETLIGAMILRRQLSSQMGFAREFLDAATWQGQRLKRDVVKFHAPVEIKLVTARRHSYSNGGKTAKREQGVEFHPNGDLEKTLFVLNVPQNRVRSVQLGAKPYLMQSDDKMKAVVCVFGDELAQEWFTTNDKALKTVDFQSFVDEWKPKPAPGTGTRGATKYTINNNDHQYGERMTAAELEELDDVLYMTVDDAVDIPSDNQYRKQVVRDNTVVFLSKTQRLDVFRKKVPHAKAARPVIVAAAQEMLDSLTDNDLETIMAMRSIGRTNTSVFDFLEERRNDITNLSVVTMLDMYKKAKELREGNEVRIRELQLAAALLGQTLSTNNSTTIDMEALVEFPKKLPLLTLYFDQGYWRRKKDLDDHAITYVNAVNL